MSDIYKNPSESQKIFNELLDALKDKKKDYQERVIKG